jgi:hypothetical protein
MVSCYRIQVGYNAQHQADEVWGEIKNAVDAIQADPSRIVCEVFRLEPNANRELIEEVSSLYRKPVIDQTIQIVELGIDKHERWIGQTASGSDPGRDAKESCRRAVCRLVMEELHRKKMEVDIVVC